MIINYVKKQYPKVRVVDTETLSQWLKTTSAARGTASESTTSDAGKKNPKVALLDVRPQVEYEVGFIPTAHRVDPEENDMRKLMQKINQISPSSESDEKVQVVMYCSVGYRASILATRLEEFLKAEGGEPPVDVYNLEGSIFKWANEDREMVDGTGQKTQCVHPYSRVWCYLVDSHRRKYKL